MPQSKAKDTKETGPETIKDISRRSHTSKPILQFDRQVHAWDEEDATSNRAEPSPLHPPVMPVKQSKAMAVPSSSSLPPHLLMASLLEQLCHMYVPDRSLAQRLFKKLCEQLSKLNIIAPLSHLDEMSALRFEHRSMLIKIMRTAVKSLNEPMRALTSNGIPHPVDRLASPNNDITDLQTSRYRNEFREMEVLGKGGFGVVFKAHNYLDGREYAVKKIRFKRKSIHNLKKMLREVRALASLQHTNIVGYNAAWMEYDSPFSEILSSSNTSPSRDDVQVQQPNINISENVSENERSMSIEFLSDGEDDANNTDNGPGCLPKGMAATARLLSSVQQQDRHGSGDTTNKSYNEKTSHNRVGVSKCPAVSSTRQEIRLHKKLEERADQHIPHGSASWVSSSYSSVSESVSIKRDSSAHVVNGKSPYGLSKPQSHKSIPYVCKSTSPLKVVCSQLKVSSTHQSLNNDAGDFSSMDLVGPVGTLCSETSPLASTEMSVVRYRRHHSQVASHVSVKIIPLEESSNGSFGPLSHESRKSRKVTTYQRSRLGRSISYDAVGDVNEVMEARNHDYGFQNSITLYIQMELCGNTLQQWLEDRNSHFSNCSWDQSAMTCDNMHIFHQLLQGVHFIHSCGIIHRDLKPRNIFLSSSTLHVKIGDFGLAKPEELNESPSSPVLPYTSDNHTSGVGTSAYAAPEQLQSSLYNTKSDMYSLGVILFEMFHVFTTEMERVHTIGSLRNNNQLSSHFHQHWPSQANTVVSLTSPECHLRPSAQDLLNSELFTSQEQKIKRLERQVVQQQEEIQTVRKDLQEKNDVIAQLQRKFPDIYLQCLPERHTSNL